MRFKVERDDAWALVPGPLELGGSINSDSVREVADYAAIEIEAHVVKFDGLTVTHGAEPDHECWKARIVNDSGSLSLKMTLHDENTFGGFVMFGDCDRQLVLDFWAHLQDKFPAIWLFAPDLCLYSPAGAVAGPLA